MALNASTGNYEAGWDTTGYNDGSHGLTVTATDTGSNTTNTAPTTVTVNNAVVALSTTVTTDKASYKRGQTVTITGKVTDGTSPISGAAVSLKLLNLSGATYATGSGTTDSSGRARFTW